MNIVPVIKLKYNIQPVSLLIYCFYITHLNTMRMSKIVCAYGVVSRLNDTTSVLVILASLRSYLRLSGDDSGPYTTKGLDILLFEQCHP